MHAAFKQTLIDIRFCFYQEGLNIFCHTFSTTGLQFLFCLIPLLLYKVFPKTAFHRVIQSAKILKVRKRTMLQQRSQLKVYLSLVIC